MPPSSRAAATRGVAVLLTCLALASAGLAAAHGGAKRSADPAAAVIGAARSHLGDRYVWGAAGPDGFDCSGLMITVWGRRTHHMPRTSAQQQAWAVPIPAAQALPGDLVFFGEPVTHVGLVLGRNRAGLRMIDASSSQHGVVERQVWGSGVVRFGRVPRRGMPPVRPWTPPAVAAPAPVALVSPAEPALHGKAPVKGLPRAPAASSATMKRFVALARGQVGARGWSDTRLVAALWHRAGGAPSPDSRTAIANRTHRVLLRSARVGDLVVYASPNDHVGVYVGGGWMVDASRSLGAVVLRPVWADPGVRVLSWNR
ncbi:MAG: hypothetical protein JWO22_2020 [Frankiales bacterium]|nr:hypothetical protein [Frankiales bacterium]